MKSALIIGITGPDGSQPANLLVEKGSRVAGTSRNAQMANKANLAVPGWKAGHGRPEVAHAMVQAERDRLSAKEKHT